MKTRTHQILSVLHILSWITFIAMLINAGAIMVSYTVGIVNPDAIKKMYEGSDLYNLRQFDFWQYTAIVSFKVAIALLEAYTAYLVIKVLSGIKLANPFTMEIAELLEKISHIILGTWVVSMLYNAHINWLVKRVDGLPENLISGEFIFLAGVVYVIAQVFKKGVELQSENELTV